MDRFSSAAVLDLPLFRYTHVLHLLLFRLLGIYWGSWTGDHLLSINSENFLFMVASNDILHFVCFHLLCLLLGYILGLILSCVSFFLYFKWLSLFLCAAFWVVYSVMYWYLLSTDLVLSDMFNQLMEIVIGNICVFPFKTCFFVMSYFSFKISLPSFISLVNWNILNLYLHISFLGGLY